MRELVEAIKKAHHLALVSHIHPDGDAVGSLLGLQLALEGMGKQVSSTLIDGVPESFHFLPGVTRRITPEPPNPEGIDLCLVLDASDASRTGITPVILSLGKAGRLGVIDHHPKGDLARYATFTYLEEEASATARMVYDLVVELGIRITPAIAQALLTGIYTDTGGFQYLNTTTDLLEVAAELMRRGGRLDTIVKNLAHTKTLASLRLLGIALERIRLVKSQGYAISVLSHSDIIHCEADTDDIPGIIGELNVLPEARFTIMLVEITPGVVRGTLRTGDGHRFNVGQLAKLLGGGGHPRAAGFIVPGRIIQNARTGSWRVEPPQ